jgi:hypothetical protein
VVTSSYGSRRSDHGVHASAGELTEVADWPPIVVHECPQNIGILGEIFLCKGRHHTPGIEERHVEPCPMPQPEVMTDLVVLDKPRPSGADDHVHAEPARLEAALGPKLVQPRERGRRHDR